MDRTLMMSEWMSAGEGVLLLLLCGFAGRAMGDEGTDSDPAGALLGAARNCGHVACLRARALKSGEDADLTDVADAGNVGEGAGEDKRESESDGESVVGLSGIVGSDGTWVRSATAVSRNSAAANSPWSPSAPLSETDTELMSAWVWPSSCETSDGRRLRSTALWRSMEALRRASYSSARVDGHCAGVAR